MIFFYFTEKDTDVTEDDDNSDSDESVSYEVPPVDMEDTMMHKAYYTPPPGVTSDSVTDSDLD